MLTPLLAGKQELSHMVLLLPDEMSGAEECREQGNNAKDVG
jgi:hypothetical protein